MNFRPAAKALLLPLAGGIACSVQAVAAPPPMPANAPSYADLADLADAAPSVIRAKVARVAVVEPARAPGVRPGWARIYVEARVSALLAGPPLAGDAIRYLADVPLDARGKVPRLAKREVLLFGRSVEGKTGQLQLVAPDAQLPFDPVLEQRVRAVLAELLAAGAPGRVDKVREAIFVPGTLAGAGETQMFLSTADGEPASITVVHTPGEPPRWSVSFSEIVDSSGEPPARDTLAWYRLACFLPATLAPAANVSATPDDKARAGSDYAMVRGSLGACPRTRSPA